MKERNVAEDSLTFNSNTPFSNNDLLTGPELSGAGIADAIPAAMSQEIVPQVRTSESDIPDIHKMEGMPNAARRMEIQQHVNNQLDKVENIETQIKKDVESAQKKKFEGSPKTPKEVLKSLIAKGEYTENFQLFGQTWTLRALDQGDTILSLDEVRDSIETASGRVLALMFGTVTYSIEAINGQPVYEWFEEIKLSAFNNDRMEYHVAIRKALRKYLEAMPPGVIDTLYEKYLELDSKRAKALEELKNS